MWCKDTIVRRLGGRAKEALKQAAQRTDSTPRETAPPGDVSSRRSCVSCAGLGPPFAVPRLSRVSRRSYGSPPQPVSGLFRTAKNFQDSLRFKEVFKNLLSK